MLRRGLGGGRPRTAIFGRQTGGVRWTRVRTSRPRGHRPTWRSYDRRALLVTDRPDLNPLRRRISPRRSPSQRDSLSITPIPANNRQTLLAIAPAVIGVRVLDDAYTTRLAAVELRTVDREEAAARDLQRLHAVTRSCEEQFARTPSEQGAGRALESHRRGPRSVGFERSTGQHICRPRAPPATGDPHAQPLLTP